MFLEEYSYKIEIRKGVLRGLSRGCQGNGCICYELEKYKKRYNVRKRQVLKGDEEQVAAFHCNLFVSKVINGRCQTGDCVVNAFKLNPELPACELEFMQLEDNDIRPVWLAVENNPDKLPEWKEISGYRLTTKAYFAEWDRLKIVNGVLY